jgi:uncharacterized membrane protein
MKKVRCEVTNKMMDIDKCTKVKHIRDNILNLLLKDNPDLTGKHFVSNEVVNKYRKKYLGALVQEEVGDVTKLETEVVNAVANNEILSENIEPEIEEKLTLGQKLADAIARFGGSWVFIIVFFTFIILWMGVNVWLLAAKPFDPYPFILLNLFLSCLAAIQAPIIMMSQNRVEHKDRIRGEHDYKINLKAELEIKLLHEKIDFLIKHQNERLIEIQEIQADYLEDIMKQIKDASQKK